MEAGEGPELPVCETLLPPKGQITAPSDASYLAGFLHPEIGKISAKEDVS